MSKRYQGNIISASTVNPSGNLADSTASGVWSLLEAYRFTSKDNWPIAGNFPRAIVGGGLAGQTYNLNVIQYVALGSSGDFADFGDLTTAAEFCGAVSSSTRAVFSHGQDGDSNVLDYVTIASTGNATDFGDATANHNGLTAALSNATRGLFQSERNPANLDLIDYITIASTGNATTFGNLTTGRQDMKNACSSSTRGLFAGGRSGGTNYDIIDYVTIASAGNATDFGDLSNTAIFGAGGLSSGTRGVFAGGERPAGSSQSNVMEYVTIASTGNVTDFGDLTDARGEADGTSNGTLGIFIGGKNASSTNLKSVDKITIASTGNATDFGDVTSNYVRRHGATSSAHGGLQA